MPEVKPQEGRTVDNSKFYNSTIWRKVSMQYRNKHPLCEVSEQPTPADVVDHLIPISQGGAKLDPKNLMAMSHEKHNKKSGMEAHKPILVQWELNERGYKIPLDREEIIKLLR